MMKNRVRKSIALIALFITMTASAVQAQIRRGSYYDTNAPTQAELNTVINKSRSALGYMASFWSNVFSSMRRPFTAPRVVMSYDSAVKAHYDPKYHAIYFNPTFFVEQMREAARLGRKDHAARLDGDMAFIVILAHEYGHAVQAQLNLLEGLSKDVELQADSLAGAFVKYAEERGLLDPGDDDEALQVLLNGRDPTAMSRYHPRAHGTGADRVNYYNRGRNGGVRAAFWR
ncbi:MAG: neutral zinc metallopeptidase [Acidobacteriota bacterium]